MAWRLVSIAFAAGLLNLNLICNPALAQDKEELPLKLTPMDPAKMGVPLNNQDLISMPMMSLPLTPDQVQDGRIKTRVKGRELDLRVSTVPTVHGESVVMRVLDRASVRLNLDTPKRSAQRTLGGAPPVGSGKRAGAERLQVGGVAVLAEHFAEDVAHLAQGDVGLYRGEDGDHDGAATRTASNESAIVI